MLPEGQLLFSPVFFAVTMTMVMEKNTSVDLQTSLESR